MPKLLWARNRSSLHDLKISVNAEPLQEGEKLTHGAIMILAPGIGSSFPSIEAGTWASHSSSSLDKVEGRDEYHDPAWLASLVVIFL